MAGFQSFAEFYPHYLQQHQNRTCRRLHVVGSCLSLLYLAWLIRSGLWHWFPLVFLIGYGFAWLGHLFFEKNRPATFKHPFYSFAGDWVMLKDVVIGKIPF